MYEDLRKQLNQIAQGQWAMIEAGNLPADNPYYAEFDSYAYAQTEQLYDALREQFDAIKDGEMQEDNAGAKRQLKNLQDQIIMGGELGVDTYMLTPDKDYGQLVTEHVHIYRPRQAYRRSQASGP